MIHDSSIEQDVLFFVFPHSEASLGSDLTLDNLNDKVQELAEGLFNKLRGK